MKFSSKRYNRIGSLEINGVQFDYYYDTKDEECVRSDGESYPYWDIDIFTEDLNDGAKILAFHDNITDFENDMMEFLNDQAHKAINDYLHPTFTNEQVQLISVAMCKYLRGELDGDALTPERRKAVEDIMDKIKRMKGDSL